MRETHDKSEERKSLAPEKEPSSGEEQEVAALSEMMCSLVTNNDGDTRYIGAYVMVHSVGSTNTEHRLIIWFLHLFPQRRPMGQSKDGR